MARLVIKSDGFKNQVIELRWALTDLGRSPENHFQINHQTISARHCEIMLAEDHLLVRDCGSTNGTFVNRGWLDQGGGALCRPGVGASET